MEITAEGRIIYSHSLHTVTPSTQPAADGAALRKKNVTLSIKKKKEKSAHWWGKCKEKGTYPERWRQSKAVADQPEAAWEVLADGNKNIPLSPGGMLSSFHPMYGGTWDYI